MGTRAYKYTFSAIKSIGQINNDLILGFIQLISMRPGMKKTLQSMY